jgi:hypothetical protein
MKDIDDAQQTVLRLDQEQDSRPLSDDELTERRVAKEKTLALAIVDKAATVLKTDVDQSR